MADWRCLHSDMLMLVARYLKEVPDHLAFAAVCSSWRSVALEIRPSFPLPVPGLMFPGKSNSFFSLSEQRLYKGQIHLSDNDVCVGSHGGWLFIMHQNFEISLLNPFSRKRLRLPPMTSFPNLGEAQFELIHEFYVQAAAVSSENINSTPEDITVMVSEGGFRRLAFAKPGDSSWCLIEDDPGIQYTGIMFYKGQFYAIGQKGLVVCDVGPNPKSILIAAVPPMDSTLSLGGRSVVELVDLGCRYLVELVGELVLVVRWLNIVDGFNGQDNGAGDDEDEVGFDVEDWGTKHDVDRKSWYRTMIFSVYKMNFVSHEWVPLKDLSNHVIFVGRNTAFSMPVWSSQGQECKGNCIYFTDDCDDALTPYCREGGLFYGYDMGVFDVKNGIIKPRNGNGKKLFPPPMWVNYLPW